MIIDEPITVRWNVSNRAHYGALGYIFTKNGDSLTVRSIDLPYGSKTKVTVQCDKCGDLWKTRRNIAQDLCKKCRHKQQHGAWQDWELELIQTMFEEINDVSIIAEKLGRSKTAVQIKANRNGLKKKNRKKPTSDNPFSFNGNVSDTEAMLFMYQLGDGWNCMSESVRDTGYISTQYQGGFSGDYEGLQNIQEDIRKLFPHIELPEIGSTETQSSRYGIKGITNQFHIGTALVKHFLLLGAPVGKKAETPFLLPDWLMNGTLDIKRNALSGLYCAEGSVPQMQINDKTVKSLFYFIFRFFCRETA